MPPQQRELPPLEDLDDRADVEQALGRLLATPLSAQMNGFDDTDIYLATSWLGVILRYIRHSEGDRKHTNKYRQVPKRQLLVAVGNRLEIDVPTLLDADPDEEVRLIYDALRELTNTCDNPLAGLS